MSEKSLLTVSTDIESKYVDLLLTECYDIKMRILRYFFSSHFEKHIVPMLILSLIIGLLMNLNCSSSEELSCSGINIGKWLMSSLGIYVVGYFASSFALENFKKDPEYMLREAKKDSVFKGNIETVAFELKSK